jgi:hypothetical protein
MLKIFDAGEYFQIRMRVNEEDELIGYKAVYNNERKLSRNDHNG